MFRKIKVKLMYSFPGILLGSFVFFLMFQVFSLILTGEMMKPLALIRVYIGISIVITAFLCVSGISLTRHEGFRVRNLVGIAFGCLWIAGDMLCLFLTSCKIVPQWFSGFLQVFGCYMNLLLSGMLLMAFIAAKHKPAYDKDFVIIPGCSISKQGGLLPLLKGRTNRAIRFAWDQECSSGKQAHYIPTGGQGPDEIMSEGSAMEFYLLSHGAEQYEVLPEKLSVNTYENMLFSKKIIDAELPKAKTCFVTTNYHVLRSGMLARRAGLDAEGVSSDTKWYFWPNGLAREVIAIFSMFRLQQLIAAALCIVAGFYGI